MKWRPIACVAPHQVSNLRPERGVRLPPVGSVSEALALVSRDLVVDKVQRRNGHARGLHHAADLAGVVHEVQPLTHSRQPLTREILDGKGRRCGLLAAQHCSQQPVAQTAVAVVTEAQALNHVSSVAEARRTGASDAQPLADRLPGTPVAEVVYSVLPAETTQ